MLNNSHFCFPIAKESRCFFYHGLYLSQKPAKQSSNSSRPLWGRSLSWQVFILAVRMLFSLLPIYILFIKAQCDFFKKNLHISFSSIELHQLKKQPSCWRHCVQVSMYNLFLKNHINFLMNKCSKKDCCNAGFARTSRLRQHKREFWSELPCNLCPCRIQQAVTRGPKLCSIWEKMGNTIVSVKLRACCRSLALGIK